MAELRPYPFAALIRRMLHELAESDGVFDLPKRTFFRGESASDLSVSFHGSRAATPLGPAAGPQTQMAQNLLLSWLSGCRIMELKTVQVNDRLEIPRPCIDMQTIGYNVEWSQELRLAESLEEYVKGSMLIEILQASGGLELAPGLGDFVFDMSVGYDLAGIQSEPVERFIDGMKDCSEVVERLRKQIPDEFKEYRELDFNTKLSSSLTLSTFHGCPPDEIEKIIEFLLCDKELDCIAKLNPTLLGPEVARDIMSELGYSDIVIPDSAFTNDTSWEQALGFVERLGEQAQTLGRSFGVKFSNTLLVENHRDFFPVEEKAMYLSGPPLHVLAMTLVGRFREHFGDRFPISFSAGIDRNNFADAAAIGLVPITVCSDLLKPGGYARASGYLTELHKRMDAVGAADLDDFVMRAYGNAATALAGLSLSDERIEACKEVLKAPGDLKGAAGTDFDAWLSATRLLNTRQYVAACSSDARYSQKKNAKPPKKVGTHLELFDCLSCNKCLPVCPNDANFAFELPAIELEIVKLRKVGETWKAHVDGVLKVEKKAQYGNFADFCNECGNCDVFCPEDGGPYIVKSRFFGSYEDWKELSSLDGFFFETTGEARSHGRFAGKEFRLCTDGDRASFQGESFEVQFDIGNPSETMVGQGDGEVDLSYFHIMTWVRKAVLNSASNYLHYLK